MLITRRSTWSEITRSKELPITDEQMRLYKLGELVEVCFPHLSLADREFVLTGMTQEEYNQMVDKLQVEAGPDDPPDILGFGEGARA